MDDTMNQYDVCIAWNWIDDGDFIAIFTEACTSRGLSVLHITEDSLLEDMKALESGQLTFRSYIDRASDSDKRFITLNEWAHDHTVYRINPQECALRTLNKATMHLDLISAGIYTPHTIILPPYEKQPVVSGVDIPVLGENFFIKPAHGGGGTGVVRYANSMHEVQIARQAFPADYYLLQRYIKPVYVGVRPAWFRVISCGGAVFPNWWNPVTHVYSPVSRQEIEDCVLPPLWTITETIAKICGLDLFSTEIALTPGNCFVVVDYVNDQIDLRLQSTSPDGVPDQTVVRLCEILASMIREHLSW
jgi:glutathione synthase/RimK-type ligase-like ATP-grasp enzyme